MKTQFNYADLENTLAARIVGIPDLAKEVRKLTDINAHTDSLLHIARYFGMKEHAAIFEAINKIHDQDGHIKMEISDMRYACNRDMWQRLIKIYGNENLTILKAAL